MTNRPSTTKKWLFKGLTFFLLTFLSACQGSPKPHIRETEEFYINDRSHILLGSTKWTIYAYSEELYEDSQEQEYKDQGINGAQVVIATYVGQVGDFSTTELFNSWGIGENNMGILLVLFFQEGESEYEYVYQETVYELGLGMMGYISAFRMDALATEYSMILPFQRPIMIKDSFPFILGSYKKFISVSMSMIHMTIKVLSMNMKMLNTTHLFRCRATMKENPCRFGRGF
ncbi:MAG: hypothetical protein WC286_02050 [Bacilli bacterium]|jgi:hypothetical protein